MKQKLIRGIRIFAGLFSLMGRCAGKSSTAYLLCALFLAVYPACSAWLLANITNAFAAARAEVWRWGVFYLVLLVLYHAVQAGSNIIRNTSIYDVCTSWCRQEFGKISAGLPLLAYEDSGILELQQRADECIEQEYLSQVYVRLINLITAVVSIGSVIGILASYHVMFCVIVPVSVLPFFLVKWISSRTVYRISRRQTGLRRKNKYLWELFFGKNSLKELQVMGSGGYLMEKWEDQQKVLDQENWRCKQKESCALAGCGLIKLAGYVLAVLLTILLYRQSMISVGLVAACFTALKSAQDSMEYFLIDFGDLGEKMSVIADYFRYRELGTDDRIKTDRSEAALQELPEAVPEDRAGAVSEDAADVAFRRLTLKDLSFSYGNSGRILDRLNLEIRRGEKIALVGVNGSGKSTLIKLLLGLYPPQEGEILLDGKRIGEVSGYRKLFSIVEQDFMRYEFTLRENVAVSDLSRRGEDRQIYQALAEAGLPMEHHSLDEYLGKEFGQTELSGGQWQKLAIARAAFRGSPFYILDEPTSALDPQMENEILERFLGMIGEKTALSISHRIGICRLVDRVVVLDHGKIAEQGSHEELLKKGGVYRSLYLAQEQWYRRS